MKSKLLYFGRIGNDPLTGGIKYNNKIIDYFVSKGWEIQNYCPKYNLSLPLPVRHLYSNFRYLFDNIRAIRNTGIILVTVYEHSQTFLFNILFRLFGNGKVIGISHHLTVHDVVSPIYRLIDSLLLRLTLKQYSHLIAISESSKKDLMKFGVKPGRITVIKWVSEFDIKQKEWQENDEVIKIIFVGTCYYRKGLHYLLDAVNELKKHKMHLYIIGNLEDDKGYVQQIMEQIKEYGLDDKITLCGRISREELNKHYSSADLFVLPSLWEGFGIVLLEAMSYGLPIIATDTGAIPEIVKHGYNGLLVPCANHTKLSEAIELLTNNAGLRKTYGENSINFLKNYNSANSNEVVFGLLDKLIIK